MDCLYEKIIIAFKRKRPENFLEFSFDKYVDSDEVLALTSKDRLEFGINEVDMAYYAFYHLNSSAFMYLLPGVLIASAVNGFKSSAFYGLMIDCFSGDRQIWNEKIHDITFDEKEAVKCWFVALDHSENTIDRIRLRQIIDAM